MAKQGGLGANFYYGGYDLSGDVASIDTMSGPSNPLDVTGIKKFAHERILGQRDGAWSITSYFEYAGATSSPGVPGNGVPLQNTNPWAVWVTVTGGTGTNVSINGVLQGTFDGTYLLPALGTIILTYSVVPTWSWKAVPTEHNAFSTLPTTDQVAMFAVGTVLGSPCACMVSKQTDYDFTRGTDASLTMKVDMAANAFGMEWGNMVTPGIRTDTAATVPGSPYDTGAGSSFGGQAYFQLFDFVGTSVTIDVQSATTSGGSYATTGLTWSAVSTSPNASRQVVSNTTTINEFIKVVTTGTFSYAVFAVALVKNPIAGQVF